MRSLGLCSPVSEEKNVLVVSSPELSSSFRKPALPGEKLSLLLGSGEGLDQASSILDILLGKGNPCFRWICPPLGDLLHCCVPGTEHRLLHTLTSLLASALSLGGGTGVCPKGMAQEQFITCSTPRLDVRPPALPSSPRAGAEGLEPGQTLPFVLQILQVPEQSSEWSVSKLPLAAESTAGLWCLVPFIKNVLPH